MESCSEVGEMLELPNIEPKGTERLVIQRIRYPGIRQQGPPRGPTSDDRLQPCRSLGRACPRMKHDATDRDVIL